MNIKQYTKKPFHVEAVKVTAENMAEVAKWCGGEIIKAPLPGVGQRVASATLVECIKTPVLRPINDRQTKAFVDDFVVRAGTGFKVYTSVAFEKTFQER